MSTGANLLYMYMVHLRLQISNEKSMNYYSYYETISVYLHIQLLDEMVRRCETRYVTGVRCNLVNYNV